MKGKWAGRRFFVILALLLLTGLSIGRAGQVTAAESQTQSNAELVRRAVADVWSGGDPAAMHDLYSADFRHFDGTTPAVGLGVNGVALRLALYRQAMPDLRFQIEDLTAVENRVITRWRAGGSYTGRFQHYLPNGSSVQWQGITIWQVENGRIHAAWSQQDDLGLARQLQTGAGRDHFWGPAYYR